MAAPTISNRVFIQQGAEAKVYKEKFYDRPCISKERFSKSYRHPQLDKSLTLQRLKAEVRSINKCRSIGVPVPSLYFVDHSTSTFYMEDVCNSQTVKEYIIQTQKSFPESAIDKLVPLAEKIGKLIGKMHAGKVIHGDLTTSNLLLKGAPEELDVIVIDFGLSYSEGTAEDKGVDLYVFERALLSTHPNTEALFEAVLKAYQIENSKESKDVVAKLEEVRLRGRKRTMVG